MKSTAIYSLPLVSKQNGPQFSSMPLINGNGKTENRAGKDSSAKENSSVLFKKDAGASKARENLNEEKSDETFPQRAQESSVWSLAEKLSVDSVTAGVTTAGLSSDGLLKDMQRFDKQSSQITDSGEETLSISKRESEFRSQIEAEHFRESSREQSEVVENLLREIEQDTLEKELPDTNSHAAPSSYKLREGEDSNRRSYTQRSQQVSDSNWESAQTSDSRETSVKLLNYNHGSTQSITPCEKQKQVTVSDQDSSIISKLPREASQVSSMKSDSSQLPTRSDRSLIEPCPRRISCSPVEHGLSQKAKLSSGSIKLPRSVSSGESALERGISDDGAAALQNLKSENFTMAVGQRAIQCYVESWKLSKGWLYCIDYVIEDQLPYSRRHTFEVKFSRPNRCRPIPRVTVSVFFYLTLSDVKPGHCPIQVRYAVETRRLQLTPGALKFQEDWLTDILNAKLLYIMKARF